MTSTAAPATTVHPTQPSPGEVASPSAFAGLSGAAVSFVRSSNALNAALSRHPDAKRKHGDGDPSRVNGLQQVQISDNGDIHIVWSWGVVTFPAATSVADLANYVRKASA